MAANASGEHCDDDQVPLTVFVDKEKNKVLCADGGKDFVNVLLSYLTLPLGVIARLVAKQSNIEEVQFGSISSLYKSVSDLDEQYLWNQPCKEMLLKPRNSMDCYCKMFKLNIDDTPTHYFTCIDDKCRLNGESGISSFRNQLCFCGHVMSWEICMLRLGNQPFYMENGFVKKNATFIICDDLCVMPNLFGTSLNLLQKHGVDIHAIHKQTVNISKKEVLDILKFSLISKTPLTDFIFKKVKLVGNLDPRNRLEFWIGGVEEPSKESDKMVVKVVRRKSNEQILFVEAEEDFADFVFSFLTFPLGGVLHMLKGLSFLNCIDNLYTSMTELSSDTYFTSEEFKENLTKPLIATEFALRNQILPIESECSSINVRFIDCKSPSSGGYSRGPLKFMVTDDLVVTPMSPSNVASYLERMNVPLNDLEERVTSIGVKEGLSILNASLTTTSALTNGLSLYIMEQLMHERRSQLIHKE